MDSTDLAEVQRTLWAAADELRANSSLAANEYRGPVLGLIFLAYAEYRFDQVREEVEAHATARYRCHPARQPRLPVSQGPAKPSNLRWV